MAVSNGDVKTSPLIGHKAASPVRCTEQGPSALCQLPPNELFGSLSLTAVLLVEFAVYFMHTGDPTPNGLSTE